MMLLSKIFAVVGPEWPTIARIDSTAAGSMRGTGSKYLRTYCRDALCRQNQIIEPADEIFFCS
jgi:hypothetical protein